jgi:hypothetical protein
VQSAQGKPAAGLKRSRASGDGFGGADITKELPQQLHTLDGWPPLLHLKTWLMELKQLWLMGR